jgi:hypothetical protein
MLDNCLNEGGNLKVIINEKSYVNCKCSESDKTSYSRKLKSLIIETHKTCIICQENFCSECFTIETRYNKELTQKGYVCPNCIENTHKNIDRFSIPLTQINNSIQDLREQVNEIKENTIDESLIPLINNTSQLLLEVKTNIPELKDDIKTLIENGNNLLLRSEDKLNKLPEQLNDLNKNLSRMFSLFGFISILLITGQILLLVKILFQ